MIPQEIAAKYMDDEYMDYVLYEKLASREKDANRREVLKKLSQQEYKHYKFWSKYAKKEKSEASGFRINLLILLRTLFGLTFMLKLLERNENKTIMAYQKSLGAMPQKDRQELRSIIKDETRHETFFISSLNESVVKYMSFIVLGLADALVEITGVHTGFLGITNSTLVAGIAGIVVGFSASIAMASAAYLQAKEDKTRSSVVSALSTGAAYFSAVVVLALPYFIFRGMVAAFTTSIIAALFLTAAFTFYGSVLNEKNFKREFAESAILIIGTAILVYYFGVVVGNAFGVSRLVK